MTAGRLSRIVEMKAIYPQIRVKLQSFPYGAYMFKNEKKNKKNKRKIGSEVCSATILLQGKYIKSLLFASLGYMLENGIFFISFRLWAGRAFLMLFQCPLVLPWLRLCWYFHYKLLVSEVFNLIVKICFRQKLGIQFFSSELFFS